MFKWFVIVLLLSSLSCQLADYNPVRRMIIDKTGKTPYEHGESAGLFIRKLFKSHE